MDVWPFFTTLAPDLNFGKKKRDSLSAVALFTEKQRVVLFDNWSINEYCKVNYAPWQKGSWKNYRL